MQFELALVVTIPATPNFQVVCGVRRGSARVCVYADQQPVQSRQSGCQRRRRVRGLLGAFDPVAPRRERADTTQMDTVAKVRLLVSTSTNLYLEHVGHRDCGGQSEKIGILRRTWLSRSSAWWCGRQPVPCGSSTQCIEDVIGVHLTNQSVKNPSVTDALNKIHHRTDRRPVSLWYRRAQCRRQGDHHQLSWRLPLQ